MYFWLDTPLVALFKSIPIFLVAPILDIGRAMYYVRPTKKVGQNIKHDITSKVCICSSIRVEKFITITFVNMSTTSNLLLSGICDRVLLLHSVSVIDVFIGNNLCN